jgi:hypothetical protein
MPDNLTNVVITEFNVGLEDHGILAIAIGWKKGARHWGTGYRFAGNFTLEQFRKLHKTITGNDVPFTPGNFLVKTDSYIGKAIRVKDEALSGLIMNIIDDDLVFDFDAGI